MYTEEEKEWVLEAINHLKRRKARPDFTRISLRMKRRHQMTITQTRQLLDSLVESGFVVKAIYKNNTSYRDVSHWRRGKLGGKILISNRMLQRFVRAIEANQSTQDGKDTGVIGVSAIEIEEWLSREKDDRCFLSGAALRDAIENEVSNGFLNKIENGNKSFYSVNYEKLNSFKELDLEEFKQLESLKFENENKEVILGNLSQSSLDEDTPESMINKSKSNLTILKMAILGIEEKQGNGATHSQIEKWIASSKSFNYSSSLKQNINYLSNYLTNQVKAGSIYELVHNGIVHYTVKDYNYNETDQPYFVQKDSKSNLQESEDRIKSANQKRAQIQENGKGIPLSLRPPSKRKRIIKNHGPDFEMELPHKSKAKYINDSKDFHLPTTLDSPVSEKSEATLEPSNVKSEQSKKRGRPKKVSRNNLFAGQKIKEKEDIETLEEENSRLGGPSEQSSVCQDDNEDCINEVSLPDASSWTSQQVADYFFEQGYEEESKEMLANDLDGVALGLLRRSDIVGPPAGGILKIKKLGTALKLFRDLRNLLYHGNADNYVDPYEERPFYKL